MNENDPEKIADILLRRRAQSEMPLLEQWMRNIIALCEGANQNKSGEPKHPLVMGGSMAGRSTLSELIQRRLSDEGFCWIDPHGDVASALLKLLEEDQGFSDGEGI